MHACVYTHTRLYMHIYIHTYIHKCIQITSVLCHTRKSLKTVERVSIRSTVKLTAAQDFDSDTNVSNIILCHVVKLTAAQDFNSDTNLSNIILCHVVKLTAAQDFDSDTNLSKLYLYHTLSYGQTHCRTRLQLRASCCIRQIFSKPTCYTSHWRGGIAG